MYSVYILQSLKDNRTYVGYTNNFERRFQEHNSGQSKATKYRAPFKLLFKEDYEYMATAKKRELYWKSGVGRKKLKDYFLNSDQGILKIHSPNTISKIIAAIEKTE